MRERGPADPATSEQQQSTPTLSALSRSVPSRRGAPFDSSSGTGPSPVVPHEQRPASEESKLERPAQIPRSGSSVLARVKALEQAAKQGEGADADRVVAKGTAAAPLHAKAAEAQGRPGEVGLAVTADAAEGGVGSAATLSPTRPRPQPLSSSSAPVLPSSGLVAQRRRSWIEHTEGSDGSANTANSPVDRVFSGIRSVASVPVSSTPPFSLPSSRPTSPDLTAPRSLSSTALAAVADTPPRSRPRLPPKSTARGSASLSIYLDTLASSLDETCSRPNSVASSTLSAKAEGVSLAANGSNGSGQPQIPTAPPLAATPDPTSQVIRKVPSLTTTPAPLPSIDQSSVSALAGRPAFPPSAFVTPAAGLAHPRPRPAVGRTPALSVAGSTGSSRPSSGAFSPHFSGYHDGRNSIFSSEGTHGHDSSGAVSDWTKDAAATPATTADYTPDLAASPQQVQEATPEGLPAKKRASKPATLQLSPESLAPTQRQKGPHTALFEGLGIDLDPPSAVSRASFDGEGDFDRELARVSLFAASLASPIASTPALAESPTDGGIGLSSGWTGGRTLSVPGAGRDGLGLSLHHSSLDDRTLVLSARDDVEHTPAFPVGIRPPRDREQSAASVVTSTTTSSVSSAVPSRRPSQLNLLRPKISHPSLRSPPSLDRLAASESEAFSQNDETDFASDEDDSYGLPSHGGPRFLGFSEFGSYASSSGGPISSPETSFVVDSGVGSRSSYRASSLSRETSRTGSGLWNEDVPSLPYLPGESGLQVVMNVAEEDMVDWRGKAIEKKELPPATTHLMLSGCTTPFQIAPLLTVTVPLLTHGLVVLDIGDCGLSEIPSAIASCTYLEELDIHGNELATQTLPSFLGTLPALNFLKADSCGLATLPSALAQLSRLQVLTLRNNHLRFLPSWLCRLGALDTLLVDGNPFHFQIHHLVRPLFVEGAVRLDNAVDSPVLSGAATPEPPSRAMSPVPPASLRSVSSPLSPPLLAGGPLPEQGESGLSPSLASPAVFTSASATPIYQKFSAAPSLAALSQLDLGEVHAQLERAQHASEPPTSFSEPTSPSVLSAPVLSPMPQSPPISAASSVRQFGDEPSDGKDGKGRKKWAKKLIKKVSEARMRSGSTSRLGALDAESRTYSQPITRGEESAAEEKTGGKFGSFGRRKKSSKARPGLALRGERSAPVAKRRSFLMLDAFSPKSDAARELFSPTPHDHAAALRSVFSYLRDLDDLSPDVSLPTIPFETSVPRLHHSPSLESTTPSLRHSPSLGALSVSRADSPAQMRRAQSTRRLPSAISPSPRPNSGRFSDLYDDSDANARSTTPLASSQLSKLADNPVKREAVLKEIVETEQTYLRGLEELCGIYVASASVPISRSGTGKKESVVPTAERRAVFGNIEAIRDFHRKIFLPDVLAAARAGGNSMEVAARVSEVFVHHARALKIYSSYINGFDDALARIQTWAKSSTRPSTAPGGASAFVTYDASAKIAASLSSSQKKRIKTWLKRSRSHPSHSQISLESYLLLPVQRIPRYRLLLESLLSCSPIHTPTDLANAVGDLAASDESAPRFEPHPLIVQAVAEMDAVAQVLNESKRENEGRAQLLVWQNRITRKFKSSLVQPHRALLRSGNMTLLRTVKRNATTVQPPLPSIYRKPQQQDESALHTLFTENQQEDLILLLCSDLLVLCKAPPPPFDQDPNAPVELYTVLRFSRHASSKKEPPASLSGKDETSLRIRIGEKAIMYFDGKTRKSALEWARAINTAWETCPM
ncbi:hypothetical protein JCM10213_006584 [Rhodosporidiobolus nylandii]